MRLTRVKLAAGGYRLVCAPDEGGLIERLQWRNAAGQWHDLLRVPPSGRIDRMSPRRFGLWPLVPFCNRAFGAVMIDGARRIALPVNDPGTGAGAIDSCIHGFGWQAAWVVTARGRGHLRLIHERLAAADPYAYRAEMALKLGQEGLHLALSVENCSDTPLPFGIGLHPWFPAAPDTTLRMRNESELMLGPFYRATGARALAAGGPYAQGPIFARAAETAHSFIGWDGEAVMATPSQGLAITLRASESLRCPVVWAPPAADFLCLEPQSHGIGAPSEAAARMATPMAQLQPGESLSGWITISATSHGVEHVSGGVAARD